jgi:effector-binding domain-containing protein
VQGRAKAIILKGRRLHMANSTNIEECDFPEMTVLSHREKDSLYSMGKHIKELYKNAAIRGLKPSGPAFSVYFEKPTDPGSVDYEILLPVEGPQEELDKLADMGGDPCLRLRVKHSYKKFEAAYQALSDYVAKEGYEISGPPREVYVRGPMLFGLLSTQVTDIYFPIKAKKR